MPQLLERGLWNVTCKGLASSGMEQQARGRWEGGGGGAWWQLQDSAEQKGRQGRLKATP